MNTLISLRAKSGYPEVASCEVAHLPFEAMKGCSQFASHMRSHFPNTATRLACIKSVSTDRFGIFLELHSPMCRLAAITLLVLMHFKSIHFNRVPNCMSVSQALVGEKACYQSVSSYGGQIVYLGTKVRCCLCAFVLFCCLCVLNSCELQSLFVELSLSAHWSVVIAGDHFERLC